MNLWGRGVSSEQGSILCSAEFARLGSQRGDPRSGLQKKTRMTQTPDNPAGEFSPFGNFSEELKSEFINDIRQAPAILRETVAGLADVQLDTLFRNWTIRQIVHHLADSHIHSYIRFKWALTESSPIIKAYEEADWAALEDCTTGSIEPPLALLEGLHVKWTQLLESMTKRGHPNMRNKKGEKQKGDTQTSKRGYPKRGHPNNYPPGPPVSITNQGNAHLHADAMAANRSMRTTPVAAKEQRGRAAAAFRNESSS